MIPFRFVSRFRAHSLRIAPLAFAGALFLALWPLAVSSQEQIAAGTQGNAQVEPDHADHPTEVIAILGERITPSIQNVPHGSAFGWLNYTNANANIRFEEGIIDKLVCRSPGQFRIEAEHLEAPLIPAGEFATLCSLMPGNYHYEVHLTDRDAPLLGRLVVEGPDAGIMKGDAAKREMPHS